MNTKCWIRTLGVSVGLAAGALAQTVAFDLIPNALGANDMSPDGRYIVGDADWNGDGFADGAYLLDTFTDNYTDLGNATDPTTSVPVVAVSDDGQFVLGNIRDPNDPNADGTVGLVAGLWWAQTGDWVSLGYLPNALKCPSRSSGYELTADGGVAVGLSWDGCNARAVRWTPTTGMVELQVLANGRCRASVVSADGDVMAGFCQGSFSRTPAVWDASGAGITLDPNGNALGEIYGMSDDGSTLLGSWLGPAHASGRASLWTAQPGGGWARTQIGGGSLLPGWEGVPMDIADDGTVVGFDFLLGNRRAWIQPGGVGPLVELQAYIESHGGSIPDGFRLEVCQAISRDGRVIVGHGFGTGAWRLTTTTCPGDLNGDAVIDLDDLLILLGDFGNAGPGAPGDADGDGDSDFDDLLVVLVGFGQGCDT